MRIDLCSDVGGNILWKQVTTGVIQYYTELRANHIVDYSIDGRTIKFGTVYIMNPVLKKDNVLFTAAETYDPYKRVYCRNGFSGFNVVSIGLEGGQYCEVNNFIYKSTSLGDAGGIHGYPLNAMRIAEVEIDDTLYVAFFYWMDAQQTIISALCVSANFFYGSFTPRYTPPTTPDEDGGYGTGDTPSGDQDGSVIVVGVGGDSVNVAPPNVSVDVEINMPEPEQIEISHPTGITIAKITETQLAYLTDALWGRDVTGFNNLWKQFENYKFNPIAGIVACHRLPSWTFVGGYDSAAAIVIAGTTIPNFNGRKPASNFASKTFTTAPITQFNTYEDFVGVTVRAYAPFVGWFDLDPSLCFGVSTNSAMCCIEFQYQVDKLNGNIGLTIMGYTVGKSDTQSHKIPLATGIGNCAYPVYITGNDQGAGDILGGFKQVLGGAASIAAGVVTENIPLTAGGISSMSTGLLNAATATHHTTSVGGCSGNAGYLSYRIPFVQVIKPRYVRPSQFTNIYGRPSYAHGKVSDFEGMYAELDVHCSSFGFANEQEQKKIIDMLAKGVHV